MDAPHDTETIDDLSALAWVQDELRRSMEAAHKAMRRYLKEAEALTGSDVDAVDPGVLRTARAQLHQGVGALELVGLPAAAQLLRASEAALQKMSGRPVTLSAAGAEAIEQASFALLDYVARLLAGKAVSPLALFPQYKAVQELAGADRIHPADLWPHDWQWRELPTRTERGAPQRRCRLAHRGRGPDAGADATTREPGRGHAERLVRRAGGRGGQPGGRRCRASAGHLVADGQRILRGPGAAFAAPGCLQQAGALASVGPAAHERARRRRAVCRGRRNAWRRTCSSSAPRPNRPATAAVRRAWLPCARPGTWRAARRSITWRPSSAVTIQPGLPRPRSASRLPRKAGPRLPVTSCTACPRSTNNSISSASR